MSNPLSPLADSALNAQWSPQTAQKNPATQAFITAESPLAKLNEQWTTNAIDSVDGPQSSPFVSEIDVGISTPQASHTPSKQSSPQKAPRRVSTCSHLEEPSTAQKRTSSFEIHEDKPLFGQDVSESPNQRQSSPSKQIFSELAAQHVPLSEPEVQAHPDRARQINEDDTIMSPRTPRSRHNSSPQKRTNLANDQSPTKPTPLRYKEGLTVATKSWTTRDISIRTHNSVVESEEHGLDDTCFSAFSEVPTEMTKNLQRSAKKTQVDPVSASPCAYEDDDSNTPNDLGPDYLEHRQQLPGQIPELLLGNRIELLAEANPIHHHRVPEDRRRLQRAMAIQQIYSLTSPNKWSRSRVHRADPLQNRPRNRTCLVTLTDNARPRKLERPHQGGTTS